MSRRITPDLVNGIKVFVLVCFNIYIKTDNVFSHKCIEFMRIFVNNELNFGQAAS